MNEHPDIEIAREVLCECYVRNGAFMTKGKRPDFQVIAQTLPDKSQGWFWRVDLARDDGLIGPFETKAEAIRDARETLGIRQGEG
jgi:hypothetical protein